MGACCPEWTAWKAQPGVRAHWKTDDPDRNGGLRAVELPSLVGLDPVWKNVRTCVRMDAA